MLIKLVLGLLVIALIAFTGLLLYHVRSAPLGGIFNQIIPVTATAAPLTALPQSSSDSPEFDPGAKVFQRARVLIATGNLTEARDKLRTIVSIYPRSSTAPEARRIAGEMNLDELLSAAWMEGKKVYKVVRGDSYLKIAQQFDTSLDMIMHLNGLMNLQSLQPGDELVVMPLNFRLVIDQASKSLAVWEGGRFVKEYQFAAMSEGVEKARKSVVSSKSAFKGERRVTPSTMSYREALKLLEIKGTSMAISSMPNGEIDPEFGLPRGYYLNQTDMEELSLITRPGNEVEIRSSPR